MVAMTDDTRGGEPRHPIGVAAERTGLSQDVLRVWERRYEAVTPGRGVGGQRLYSDLDIERLRLLALATNAGRSIGQVAGLPIEELREMVHEDEGSRRRNHGVLVDVAIPSTLIDEGVDFARALDAIGLDALLRRAVAMTGIHFFLESVAAPLLRRIGDEWHAGRLAPAQEHLASAIVQRIITSAMHALPLDLRAPHIVISTISGERHELGAILAAASAAAEGWRVTYLGADLPVAEIANVALATGANAVGVSIIYPDDGRAMLADLRELRGMLPSAVSIYVGGEAGGDLAAKLGNDGIAVVRSLADFRASLKVDAPRHAA